MRKAFLIGQRQADNFGPLNSLLRGFLHGERLRWSYGGMNGRTADLWHRALAEKALPERVRIAAASGDDKRQVGVLQMINAYRFLGKPDQGMQNLLMETLKKDPNWY